jgi:hypothetical protein
MSRTKRWIEDLMAKGEYPPEVDPIMISGPYLVKCCECGSDFASSLPQPDFDIMCPKCYNEAEKAFYFEAPK